MKHAIKVVDGKAMFLNRAEFDRDIKNWEGRKAWVVIQGRRNARSNNQNAYYWGVVIEMLGGYLGYFPEEIHELLKKKFLPEKSIQLKNEEVLISQSTTKLDSLAFEKYLESIRVWALTDLNFKIPLPNEGEDD